MVMEPLERHGTWICSRRGTAATAEYAHVRVATDLNVSGCRETERMVQRLASMCQVVVFVYAGGAEEIVMLGVLNWGNHGRHTR